MASEFLILERPDLGGFQPRDGTPAAFSWTVEQRNIPFQPWSAPQQQRTSRTDYPGNDLPTEQVLGPNYEQMTFEGHWLDKFNPQAVPSDDETQVEFAKRSVGYAVNECNAFEAMFRRGNLVQISFEDWSFVGIITNFTPERRNASEIGYSFTFSPHYREGVSNELALSLTQTAKTSDTIAFELGNDKEVALELNQTAPKSLLLPGLFGSISVSLSAFSLGVDSFASAVDQRVLAADANPSLSLSRMINAADVIIAQAKATNEATADLDASSALSHRGDAVGELCFEEWQRGLRASMREAIFRTWEARKQLDQEADPDAIALYRPQKNESVYSISRRFYGTPFQWRLIAERNRLTSSNLTGTELLIIPEVPIL